MSAALIEQFDLLATSTGGIAKLRELILSLAVRGQLVPQNPADEPASELLKRIRAEKDRLIAEGKIKRKTPEEASTEELPFELPTGWEWVIFGDVAAIERGGSPRPIQDFLTDDPDGLNWIKIGDTDKGGKYITSVKERIRREGLSKTRMVYPGDFLLTNSMSFGRPYISQIEGCIHDGWLRISPPESLDKDYLYALLSSPFIRQCFEAAAAGAVVLNLNADKVRAVPIPLPPLAEQSRIVAKVEELMALCDRLEAEQGHAARVQGHWVEAALDQLAESADADEFQRHWQHLAAHWDQLFTTPAAIDKLDATLLQLAVRGKLVPQDPADEPASELLKQIRAEKYRLILEGKIKRDKPLDNIGDNEKPFSLPDAWAWVRFGDASINRDGERIPVSSADRESRAKNYDYYGASGVIDQIDDYLFDKTLLLIGEDGANLINRSTPIAFLAHGKYWVNNHAHVIDTTHAYLMSYLCLFINAISLEPYVTGTAQPKMNQAKLNSIVVALPPLAEQSRIVAQLEKLQALTATLKARLTAAQAKQAHLAEVMIQEALVV